MKILFALFALVVAVAGGVCAAENDYDDPGMHYSPPAGWAKIGLAPAEETQNANDDSPAPVAVYAYHRGESDQRTIVITIQNFDGSLESFNTVHQSEIRKSADGAFLDKPIKTSLANGMPVYLLKINAGKDPGHFVERYEYLMIDGTRGIAVSYSGRQGDFEKKDAIDAFSSLYVVAYPRHRP